MCCSDIYPKQTLLSFLLAERQMETWHGALPLPPSSSVPHDKPVFMARNSVCTSVKCVCWTTWVLGPFDSEMSFRLLQLPPVGSWVERYASFFISAHGLDRGPLLG